MLHSKILVLQYKQPMSFTLYCESFFYVFTKFLSFHVFPKFLSCSEIIMKLYSPISLSLEEDISSLLIRLLLFILIVHNRWFYVCSEPQVCFLSLLGRSITVLLNAFWKGNYLKYLFLLDLCVQRPYDCYVGKSLHDNIIISCLT